MLNIDSDLHTNNEVIQQQSLIIKRVTHENSSVEVVKENTSFHNRVHEIIREIRGEQHVDSKEFSITSLSTLAAISTESNKLAVIDYSLNIDKTLIQSATIESPTKVLHNILTHILEETKVHTYRKDIRDKSDYFKEEVEGNIDLSPREIKSIKSLRKRKKQDNKEVVHPGRT